LEGCKRAVKEVWPPQEGENVEGHGGDPDAEGYRPGGGDGVLYDSLEAMRAMQTAPVVGAFERLALLGKGGD
jgi:elongator complex protein 1